MHHFCPWGILKKTSLLQKRTVKPAQKHKETKQNKNPAEPYMLYDSFKTNDTQKYAA